MHIMQCKVDEMMGVKSEQACDGSDLKFMIYSAHDTQVDNMMVVLTQSKTSFDYVPYASQVIFELKYSADCMDSSHCFGVSVAFNGEPMTFPGCTGDGFTETGCRWDEFKEYISSIWYSGAHADDLDAACK